jgi:hypothetical protein
VPVKYRDLTGMFYEMRWTINPLHYEGNCHVPREGLGSVVSAWRSSTKPSLAKHKMPQRAMRVPNPGQKFVASKDRDS